MAKVLIVYYSRTGHTKSLAEAIAESVRHQGIDVTVRPVKEAHVDELLEHDGVIVGSPTYYGTLAWQVKQFIDKSVRHHGKLVGKVGAAFTTSGNVGGGNETTILSILEAFLIHGMIVQGETDHDHYGPVGVEEPDERALEGATRLGETVADLVKTLEAGRSCRADRPAPPREEVPVGPKP